MNNVNFQVIVEKGLKFSIIFHSNFKLFRIEGEMLTWHHRGHFGIPYRGSVP